MATAKKVATKKTAVKKPALKKPVGLERIPEGLKATDLVLKDNTVGLLDIGKLILHDEKEWISKLRGVGVTAGEIKKNIPLADLHILRTAHFLNMLIELGIREFKVGQYPFITRGKEALKANSEPTPAVKKSKPAVPGLPAVVSQITAVKDLKVTISLPHNDYITVEAVDNVFSNQVNWKEALKTAKVPVTKKVSQLTEGQFKSFLETIAANGIWAFSIGLVVFIRGGKLIKHKVNSHERMLGLVKGAKKPVTKNNKLDS